MQHIGWQAIIIQLYDRYTYITQIRRKRYQKRNIPDNVVIPGYKRRSKDYQGQYQ